MAVMLHATDISDGLPLAAASATPALVDSTMI